MTKTGKIVAALAHCIGAFTTEQERMLIISDMPESALNPSDIFSKATVIDSSALQAGSTTHLGKFDVIVLDRFRYPRWRKTLFIKKLKSMLGPAGQILVIDKNWHGWFHSRALMGAQFSQIDRFHIFPDIESAQHLISCDATACRRFYFRAHGLSSKPPMNPVFWPRWFAIWIGADLWIHRWRLVRARP